MLIICVCVSSVIYHVVRVNKALSFITAPHYVMRLNMEKLNV